MKGFTLIEVLFSMVIISILIAGLFMVLNISDVTWSLDAGLLGLQQQARQAMDGMVREVRQSRNSNVTITGGTNLSFSIPTNITSDPVTYSKLISYCVDNGQLFRRHPQDESRVVANDINSVTFCCWNGTVWGDDCSQSKLLQIQLFAGKTVRQRPFLFNLTEKVKLRN